MWWDVKFGCTFVVLDHMPRDCSATIILKHFQTEATLGHGRSYAEARGHWTSSGCVQGIIACGSAAVICTELVLWTECTWLKTCPGNKSMPVSSSTCVRSVVTDSQILNFPRFKWELGICISSGSANAVKNTMSLFIHTGLCTLMSVLNLGAVGIRGVLIKLCSGWGQWGM